MKLIPKPEWENLSYLINKVNKLFEEIVNTGRVTAQKTEDGSFSPLIDIYETENELVIAAEIPGVSDKDISITVNDNILTLEGERRLEKNIQEERYRRIERIYGPFKKSFALTDNINAEQVEAQLKDGVLYVHLPKKSLSPNKVIEIEIKD
jgi:HSP20 family protein